MSDPAIHSYIFGPFRLCLREHSLTRDGHPIALTPKEFDTLLALVEAQGRVVGKDEILNQVWPDSYVGHGSLARNISVLRKAMGDDVIGTVPRRGYRLAIPVIPETSAPAVVDLATANRSEIVAPVHDGEPSGPSVPESRQAAATYPLRTSYFRAFAYAALVALVAVVFLLFNRASVSHANINAASRPVRVAVLPFANYTGNPQDDYLCDGTTEATIAELSRLNPAELNVIARMSAMKFKNTDRTIPQIAAELKADYILESSIQRSGDRLRITIQLVRGSDASLVWTGEYEQDLRNVLDVEQQVSIAVAQQIRLTLDASTRRRLHDAHPPDSEAYQDYLLGRFYWNKRTREGLFKSVDYFQRAIARDPKYALAYAGLADSYLVLGGGYMPDIEAYNQARTAAMNALAIDNTLADAHTSLAYEQFVNEDDLAGADANYQQALMLDPNSANAHHWYALYLSAVKRPDEAIEHIQRAMELDPLALSIRYNAGSIYLAAGQVDEAIVLAKRALELDSKSAQAHGTLAEAYRAKGLYEQAIAEFETAQKLRAEYSGYAVEVAHTYALKGEKNRARTLLASLLSDSHWGKVAPYSFAVTYAALGQKDVAFQWLKRCADDHSCTASEFNNDHSLDPLRSDPRFGHIVR